MILLFLIGTRDAHYTWILGIYGRNEIFFIQGGAKVTTHGPKECLGDVIIFFFWRRGRFTPKFNITFLSQLDAKYFHVKQFF